jgi:hypothetical protein
MGNANVDGSFTLQKTAYTRSSSHPEGSGQFMTHKLHELSYSGDFSTNGNNHLNDTIIGLDVNLDTNAGGQYAALFNGGHVGIGTTNPSAKLDISTNNTTGLRLINPDSAAANQSNDPPAILFQASGWDTDVGSRAYSARIRVNSNYSGAPDRGNTHPVMNFDLETNENNPDDTLSTKMMINADGKVGIGTTSPGYKLHVSDDRDGNFVAEIQNTSNGTIGSTGPHGLHIKYRNSSPDQTHMDFLRCSDSTATRMRVYSDGDVWTSDSGFLSSDERLKTNIQDATSKLEDIKRLKVRNFEWISEFHPEKVGEKKIGFIAQELEEVFPGLVSDHNISSDDGEVVNRKSIRMGALIPVLTKAIQEQQAIIEDLRSQNESQQSTINDLISRIETLEQ